VTPEPDTVTLTLPALPESARIVRLGGAALGLRSGLSFAEIDELRSVLDRAVALLSSPAGDDPIHVDFRIANDGLQIELSRPGIEQWPAQAMAELADDDEAQLSEMELLASERRLRLFKQPSPVGV